MNNTAKIIIGIVVIILIVWGISAAWKDDSTPMTTEPIKIGVIAPFTGDVAAYGDEIRKGVEAGVSANENIQLVYEDDKCDPKEAVTAFQKLTSFDNVKFIIGPACGSPQEAIVPLLNGKEILAVVPAAASSALYTPSGGNFYNVQYSLQDESKFVAEQMTRLGYKKVALISYANAFSQAHADSFRTNFTGTIAIDTTITDPNADVATEITKIGVAKVDAIYSPDISFFFAGGMAKLAERKVNVPVFSTYVVELPAARTLVPNVYYSYPADIADTEAAVFGLSKQAAEVLSSTVTDCNGDYRCVKSKLDSSGQFDSNGIYKRGIVLKQIKDGQPILVQ